MPRLALQEQEIANFRDEVLSAARRLFAETGYAAVTLRAIAAALGCSPMTPYRYFPGGKDEIFTLLRADAFRRFADSQEQAAQAHPEPRARLVALARAYVGFALENPHDYRIMFELAQGGAPDTAEVAKEALRSWSQVERAFLEYARLAPKRANPSGGNPRLRAQLFWATAHGMVALHLAGKLSFGSSLEDLLTAMLAEAGLPMEENVHARRRSRSHRPCAPKSRRATDA